MKTALDMHDPSNPRVRDVMFAYAIMTPVTEVFEISEIELMQEFKLLSDGDKCDLLNGCIDGTLTY